VDLHEDVAEGNGVLLPGLRTGGGQQEEVAALEGTADLSPIGSNSSMTDWLKDMGSVGSPKKWTRSRSQR
jgi:hypothetical protein